MSSLNCQDCQSETCETYSSIKEERFPKISSAFLILTNQCNLACRYCFVCQNKLEMTYQIALDSAKFLIKNSEENKRTPTITFFGGEPLLKWEEIIVPLTKYIREEYKKPFNLSITSNCTLMTEDKLEFMKENNIGLLFSIDGDSDTQNYNRPFHNGKGSFDNIGGKIDMILKYYPNMTFRATLHQPTSHMLFHNIKFAVEKGYKNMFFIPNMFEEWNESDKEVLKNQIRLYGDYFIENARNGKIIHFNNLDRMFPMILRINHAVSKNLEKPIYVSKCGLGKNFSASISTNGKIFACQEMVTNGEEFEIGDIYNGENFDKRVRLTSKFDVQKIQGLNNCENCKLKRICDGGCVANNFLKNKDVNIVPEIYCYWQQILLDEAIRICNILGNEENKLFKEQYFSER